MRQPSVEADASCSFDLHHVACVEGHWLPGLQNLWEAFCLVGLIETFDVYV